MAMTPAFAQELVSKDMEQRLLRDRARELERCIGDLQGEIDKLRCGLEEAKSQARTWKARAQQALGTRRNNNDA